MVVILDGRPVAHHGDAVAPEDGHRFIAEDGVELPPLPAATR